MAPSYICRQPRRPSARTPKLHSDRPLPAGRVEHLRFHADRKNLGRRVLPNRIHELLQVRQCEHAVDQSISKSTDVGLGRWDTAWQPPRPTGKQAEKATTAGLTSLAPLPACACSPPSHSPQPLPDTRLPLTRLSLSRTYTHLFTTVWDVVWQCNLFHVCEGNRRETREREPSSAAGTDMRRWVDRARLKIPQNQGSGALVNAR